MATTTPNYGWPVPTSTDYVKDGATAIEALGDAIDATVFGLATPGMVLLHSSLFTTSSAFQIDNLFNATYTNYRVLYVGKGSTTATFHFKYRKSAADVTNGYTSNSFYTNQGGYGTTGGGTVQVLIGDSNTDTTSLAFDIMKPNAAAASATFTTMHGFSYNKLTTYIYGGSHLTDTYTGFTLYPSTGTITGEIQIYGYRD